MPVNSETLRRLAALKLPDGALSEVLSIIADMQSGDEERKKKDRERKRKIHGNSMEIPGNEDGNSEGTETELGPYKDNHASVCGSPSVSSLRSETIITPNPSDCPQGGEKQKKSSARGARLPTDWTPSDRSIEICIAMGYPRAFVLGEGLDGFRGYWLPLPGAKALKLDWDQTFCNRMRERTDRPRLTTNARDGPANGQKFRNGHMELAVRELEQDYGKINGNGNGTPIFDVEVFLGKKPRETRPSVDGPSFDANDDAEARGELDFGGANGKNLQI